MTEFLSAPEALAWTVGGSDPAPGERADIIHYRRSQARLSRVFSFPRWTTRWTRMVQYVWTITVRALDGDGRAVLWGLPIAHRVPGGVRQP